MNIKDCATLHNGVEMPRLGLGVYLADEGGQVEQAIQWAAEVGYRSIDTASMYGNETGVGRGVRQCGVPREDMFVTTKVWNSDQGYDSTLRAFERSLERLQTGYVDLYLIHWPVEGKFPDTWRAFEHLHEQGICKAIGVSNFQIHHLQELAANANITPMVNQIEYHPLLPQPELLDYCRKHEIQVEAWAPLMRGDVGSISEIQQLAGQYQKSPTQIVLRWDLQHEVITIPKSVRKKHIEENAAIFDFELSTDDMTLLDGLGHTRRLGPDPDNFHF